MTTTDLHLPKSLIRRRISPTMFEGITKIPATVTLRGNTLTAVFEGTLTDDEQAQVTHLLTSSDDTEMVNAQLVATALSNNRTFLNLSAPTNAQTLAQVRALTRQMNALIRVTRRIPGID
jgi:hypothetical protein